MTQKVNMSGELNWLLDDLVKRVPEIERAVLLSADGLLMGASQGLSRPDAEHLSAVASGFQSLARGAGQHFGGGQVRQTVVEMDTAFLFVTAAGHGACLAVLAAPEADVGLVAFEMNLLIQRVGQNLSTTSRSPLAAMPAPGGDPMFRR